MTNKMPVVGKRYRNKYHREEWTFANERSDYFRFIGNLNQDSVLYIKNHLMWLVFEELPTSNSQETEETEVNLSEYVKTHYRPQTPEFNKWFKEKFNRCPITGEKIDKGNQTPLPVDLEKGEVNEVERALEELKKELFNKRDCHFTRIDKLENLAQKLVDALEAEKEQPIF